MPRSLLPALLLVILSLSHVLAEEKAPTPEQTRFFESKVRPVLVEQCIKCHGPDKQKAGLRLDSREAVETGGDSGPIVVAGKPDESLLIQALRYEEDGPKMPPSKRLPAEQVEVLTQWVQQGAHWPVETASAPASTIRRGPMVITDNDRAHWAFQPIQRGQLPHVNNPAWATNPVDAFVLAKLDAKGLTANPPASKVALIRRATYDLTGLPPTPQEVDAFVADTSPKAYEALIDRLLASPRYGEKWARHWLDLVRYAETNSYERDNPKPSAWRYRDYVIRAFNDDKPYDRFIREQLAGDELPDKTNDSVIATGYYRLGIWDDEPTDRDQARFDGLDDLVATTGQVFLGLTIDCARCHDHKIDPIPQKDYYKLVSFFNNTNSFRNGGPTDEVPYVEPGRELAYQERVRELELQKNEVREAIAEIEDEFRKGYQAGEKLPKGDIEELRYRFYRDTWTTLPEFDALKPEDSGELPQGLFDLKPRTRDISFGFVFEGTLVVPEEGQYTFTLDSDDGSRLTLGGNIIATDDGIHGLGDPKSAKVTLQRGRVPIRLDYFQKASGLGLAVTWSGPSFPAKFLSAIEPTKTKSKALADLASVIRTDGAKVLGVERFERYRSLVKKAQVLREQEAASESILCITEQGRVAPDTHLMLRGNAHVPGDKVEPGFLAVLGDEKAIIPEPPADAKTTGRRRALADWITSPTNPLTARVIANRLFQHHFGRGIVRSPNNYGVQGDKPTHPELLDWLATELIAQGWHLKPLHRLIMTSQTYQMSSNANPEASAKDPMNDSLWRMDMRRLTAEEIRDSILAVSGQLNLTMSGPGVFPEIPAEVMAGQSIPGRGWGKSSAENQARRSIYVHAKRSLIMPILEGFDQAETDRSSPVRFSTTQPTQALGMINGTFLHKQAATLADRLKREAGDDLNGQVRLALRLTTGRQPAEPEIQRGVRLIQSLETQDGLSRDEARRIYALLALNLNEFLFLD